MEIAWFGLVLGNRPLTAWPECCNGDPSTAGNFADHLPAPNKLDRHSQERGLLTPGLHRSILHGSRKRMRIRPSSPRLTSPNEPEVGVLTVVVLGLQLLGGAEKSIFYAKQEDPINGLVLVKQHAWGRRAFVFEQQPQCERAWQISAAAAGVVPLVGNIAQQPRVSQSSLRTDSRRGSSQRQRMGDGMGDNTGVLCGSLTTTPDKMVPYESERADYY